MCNLTNHQLVIIKIFYNKDMYMNKFSYTLCVIILGVVNTSGCNCCKSCKSNKNKTEIPGYQPTTEQIEQLANEYINKSKY